MFQSTVYVANLAQSQDPSDITEGRFRATVLAKLAYCSPAWCVFCSAVDRERLDASGHLVKY